MPREFALRCADVGCGSGAGAVVAAHHLRASNWLLIDINPQALRLAAVNGRQAGRRRRRNDPERRACRDAGGLRSGDLQSP
jgi:methylase of polypeptide subunit release factors